MRNEERIIELLSEYLRKSDKHEEEIGRNQKNIERNQLNIEKVLQEISALRSDSLKHQIQQEVILKELLSISKRVSGLE